MYLQLRATPARQTIARRTEKCGGRCTYSQRCGGSGSAQTEDAKVSRRCSLIGFQQIDFILNQVGGGIVKKVGMHGSVSGKPRHGQNRGETHW